MRGEAVAFATIHNASWAFARASSVVTSLKVAICVVVCLILAMRASAAEEEIVSIGGDVTEIIYALGGGDRIIAVDTTSTHPPEALASNANVGYMRALSAEGVLSVGGQQIIASVSAGPPEAVAALQASSRQWTSIPDDLSADGIATKIRAVAAAIGMVSEGEGLATQVERQFAALAQARGNLSGDRPRVLFVLGVRNGRAIVGGTGTSADAVISLAGGANAVTDVTGYKPLSDEALLALAPAAILTMRRGAGSGHSLEALESLVGIQSTPAARTGRIFEMDGQRLLGFGPRTPEAALDLMGMLYGTASQ